MQYQVRLITAQNNPTVFHTEAHHSTEAESNARRFYPGCRIQTVIPTARPK